jgi:hypothetical protein
LHPPHTVLYSVDDRGCDPLVTTYTTVDDRDCEPLVTTHNAEVGVVVVR